MPDNGHEILEAILEVKDQIIEISQKTSETNTEVKVISQRLLTVETRVKEHDDVLYGEAKKSGEGGLLDKIAKQDIKITGIGGRLDSFQRFFVLIWTGIFAVIQLAISVLKNFFSGNS
jgi:hypothetical protein